ncbi:MAG: hypothetical protein A2259_03350 [Candidatus Moranbacteria bacterium RIFOXYA2_FULL_43_15]|nr:MAG: hypothetical protein A2259_03350 [Candidatus Moranbacteria bacterium RIFOXYA2_FULL_43_15]
MSKSLLITRPNYEITTRYLYVWNKEVIRKVKDKGVAVMDLQKEKANRKEFEGRMRKINPALVLLNGHGGRDCVSGHDNEIIVKAGENEDIFERKIVYALACQSALFLGPKSVQAGAVAFIGYKKDFIFFTDDSKAAHPEKDSIAKLFLDPSNRLSISLIKGNSVLESVKKISKTFFRKYQKSFKQRCRLARLFFLNDDPLCCLEYAPSSLLWRSGGLFLSELKFSLAFLMEKL